MTKKTLNQNDISVQGIIDNVEPDFVFNNEPINRFKIIKNSDNSLDQSKLDQLLELKKKINSIENCNLKNNSKTL